MSFHSKVILRQSLWNLNPGSYPLVGWLKNSTRTFAYQKGPMHAAATQVGGILGKVNGPEPLHDAVVGPQHDLPWLVLYWLVQLEQKQLHIA